MTWTGTAEQMTWSEVLGPEVPQSSVEHNQDDGTGAWYQRHHSLSYLQSRL